MRIKILGVDNIRTKDLESKVKKIVKKMSLIADIQVVTVLDDILRYDVMGIPALLVNEKVVCQKSIPDEVKLFNCLKKIIENKDLEENDLPIAA